MVSLHFPVDSNNMLAALIGVETIYSTATAVAPVLRAGTEVNSGDEGGNSRNMQAALIGVMTSYSRSRVLAAILKDGTLVTGGQSIEDSDSKDVQAAVIGLIQSNIQLVR